MAGKDKYYSGNSRADLAAFIQSAIEFEKAHEGVEWGVDSDQGDYLEAIEDWYIEKFG